MFRNLLDYFFKKINKPNAIFKINLWFYTSLEIFANKLEKRIAWFSIIFDKLHLNKLNISNKKWEFDYIVRRTWYVLALNILYIIFYFLFIDFNCLFDIF